MNTGHYVPNPNYALLLRENPQNYHTFQLFEFPPKRVIEMDPLAEIRQDAVVVDVVLVDVLVEVVVVVVLVVSGANNTF